MLQRLYSELDSAQLEEGRLTECLVSANEANPNETIPFLVIDLDRVLVWSDSNLHPLQSRPATDAITAAFIALRATDHGRVDFRWRFEVIPANLHHQ